jgi:thioredoxin-dependent peroxiredoxin
MRTFLLIAVGILSCQLAAAAGAAMPPQPGETAPNFSLRSVDGKAVELAAVLETKPVLLVVLRGWPGYQCPLCTRQVHEFVARAADFAGSGAQVVMVYPGPADQLQAHAREFLAEKEWPADFIFLLDPDYTFTARYGVRWDSKNETAYPSTFVIDQAGKVRFAQVSRTHGGRVGAAAALEAVRAAK